MRSPCSFLVLMLLASCSKAPCPPQAAPWYAQGNEVPRFAQRIDRAVLNQATLSARASYLELRKNGTLVGRVGWRCAVPEADLCARVHATLPWPRVGPALLVESPPGQLTLLEGEQKIGAWLGPVDSLPAAALRATVGGYEVHDDATGEPEGDHWLLVVYGEPPERRPQVIRMTRNGVATRAVSER